MTSKQKEHVLDTVPQDMAQETSACVYERTSERPRVDVRPCVAKHKREGNTKSHKVIGCKDQINYVTKGDVSSPMVLEEAEMPKCVTNAHKEREVAVATTPSTRY